MVVLFLVWVFLVVVIDVICVDFLEIYYLFIYRYGIVWIVFCFYGGCGLMGSWTLIK